MESHRLLKSANIKLDPICELSSSGIKLEPVCEVDSVQSSAIEIISEPQVFDQMDSKIPASVKIEQPEVYVDYPGEDMENMESHSLLPNANIKLEPVCEMRPSDNIKLEPICEVRSSDNIKIEPACEVGPSANIKLELAWKVRPSDIKLEPAWEVRPSDNITLEPVCEADSVQSSTIEIISEPQIFDQIDSKIPASFKIEQPEVYVDYPGEDIEIHLSPQSSPSLQEHSHMEKKMVFGNIDWRLVKQELPDAFCEDKSQRFSTISRMASSCNFQELAGHSESKIPDNIKSCIHHQEVSLTGTMNGYTVSQQHAHCSHMSENVFSLNEINTKPCLTNGNCQLHNAETPVKHTQISWTSLDNTVGYTSCSPQSLQAEDTSHVSDACEINVCSYLHKTNTGEKSYKCGICGESFTNANLLKYHMNNPTGECVICGKSFTEAENMKQHMRTHYKCDICNASFTQSGNLTNHMRTHTGKKPRFTKSGRLLKKPMRTHAEEAHENSELNTGEKPYKCDICGVSFTAADNLKTHMITHTGEKPYKCYACDACFTESVSLKQHMRNHTGKKPYKCDICDTSFAHTSHLKYHMKTHTVEKPYKCDICPASFMVASSLKHHMLNHK